MKKFALVLLGFLLALGALYWFLSPMRRGELAQKPIYAALQSSWLKHRDRRDSVIEERPNGLLLVGVLDEKERRVWIALNESRDDGALYIIPISAESGIKCETISLITRRFSLDAEVADRLKSACIPAAQRTPRRAG
ncbi:hypothetical protein [Lysobacter capsici]|uniref:hypothetical protein n=1 Tax=Lysobacter capsici TaxID=435897 RepID=UPI0011DF6CEE|nr:hypothetical protein [Lysobacter capsici]